MERLTSWRVPDHLKAVEEPVLYGEAPFAEVVAQGIVSSLHRDNAKVACRVDGPEPLPAWLFDPQTSG